MYVRGGGSAGSIAPLTGSSLERSGTLAREKRHQPGRPAGVLLVLVLVVPGPVPLPAGYHFRIELEQL